MEHDANADGKHRNIFHRCAVRPAYYMNFKA